MHISTQSNSASHLVKAYETKTVKETTVEETTVKETTVKETTVKEITVETVKEIANVYKMVKYLKKKEKTITYTSCSVSRYELDSDETRAVERERY